MSRIDEALRRAQNTSSTGPVQAVSPVDEAVLWDFPDEQPAASATTLLDIKPAAAVGETTDAVLPGSLMADVPAGDIAPSRSSTVLADETSGVQAPTVVPFAVRPAGPPETLVTGTGRKDAIEQYRKLAATLHHVQANRNIRVILCSSAMMSEGKTVTAANLALTLSQSYQRRVLLIDADLRRPRIHQLFNLPNREGLYEALGAEHDRKVNVVSLSPWLSVVTAGRPGSNPIHALTSERLARVLEDAGTSFDWVIIDTPPVLVLPDAGLLMAFADAAVLVVGAGMTSYRMVKRAVDTLGRDRIVGVVMNRAADHVLQDGYGSYYGYYEAPAGAR